MGVVARQGIKYSIISYLSFILGTLSAIFIYPADTEFYGKLRFILPSAELISPFVIFGLSYANVKFYQYFKQEGQQLDFLLFSLKIIVINFIIIISLFYFFTHIFHYLGSVEIKKMDRYIFPVVFILSITQLLSKYISNNKRIVVTGIFENFFPKLGAVISFVAYVYWGVKAEYALFIFIGFFLIALLGILYYFKYLNKDKLKGELTILKDRNLRKDVFYFCLFSVLGSLGSQLALNIDNIMIAGLIDYQQNGIYSILMSVVAFLKIPMMGILAISAPVIVEKFKNNKLDELREFYQKVSHFLFLFGTVLFCCIISGIDYLFLLMKSYELLQAKSIIYILGTAILFDLATGFNSQIISFSDYYRFNIYTMLFLAVLTITLNWVFIVHFKTGIIGVASATAISLILFNIVKIVFNYYKFKIQPFTIFYIPIIITGISAVVIAYFIPVFSNNWLNLFCKPIVVLIVFYIFNLFFKFISLQDIFSTNFKSFLIGKK